eukprot:TRINITY_DN21593_c0_g1_i3.p2 TRINITY_DN21593_c0_g1~~TRINITY_DN21593_c0_g1_i3.p2  ORF type:complete len:144 (-),score=16.09 TRINITY_DN21593_c0_g1_i3:83-514(-)
MSIGLDLGFVSWTVSGAGAGSRDAFGGGVGDAVVDGSASGNGTGIGKGAGAKVRSGVGVVVGTGSWPLSFGHRVRCLDFIGRRSWHVWFSALPTSCFCIACSCSTAHKEYPSLFSQIDLLLLAKSAPPTKDTAKAASMTAIRA